MNIYKERYKKFILSRYDRIIPDGIYTEKHHILPKSLGGSDDSSNIIILTAREHFIAHWLLWKAYGGKMIYAFNMMNKNNEIKSSRVYSSLREDFAAEHSKNMRGVNSRENHPLWGKNHSQETKDKISNNLKDLYSNPEDHPFFGKKHSKDTKDKISKSRLGKYVGENHPRFGIILDQSIKDKISNSLKGKSLSEKTKNKISEKSSNTIWINNGDTCKRIPTTENIPEGFTKGRLKKSS